MNYNMDIECEVCKNVIRLKVTAGYELENPFVYSCPVCKITISGYLIWNENIEDGFIKEFKCINGRTTLEKGNESHLLQLATEFFTDKIKEIEPDDPTLYLSPYMMNLHYETNPRRKGLLKYIIDEFDQSFHISIRLWELYTKRNYKYLNRQLLSNGFVQQVPLGMVLKVNYPTKMVEVLYTPFNVILNEKKTLKKLSSLREELDQLKKVHLNEFIELKTDLEELIGYADENIVKLLTNFSEYYRNLWPIILNDIYNTDNIENIKGKKGILTSDFERLKDYYVEAYEKLCSILPIFLGIQNIIVRGNRNYFHPKNRSKFPKIKTISDYEEKVQNKGNKVIFFEEENKFKELFNIKYTLNNLVRNSIGHYSYFYEPDSQLIKFMDRNKVTELYLIEFGELLLQTFYASFTSLEVIMFLKNMDNPLESN